MPASIGSELADLALPKRSPREAAFDGRLGQQDFLKLMTTQLRNQDPLKPLENGEFLGQLAQFGTVSGLDELNASFDGLAASLVSSQALQATQLVGRRVLHAASAAVLPEDGAIGGAVELDAPAAAVTVSIMDASGRTVRTLDLGDGPAGLVRFRWDGTTSDGEPAPAGTYSINAVYASEGQTLSAPTFVDSEVDSVVLDSDGLAVQLASGESIPFSVVREVS